MQIDSCLARAIATAQKKGYIHLLHLAKCIERYKRMINY